jgi:lysophospholipase L1-like esterase/pimeloyl-ACP methyl ester carboxylesterase
MKKMLFLIALLSITFNSSGQDMKSFQSDPIKIACIGNSITYGSGMSNRENNAYPKQLQAMLGAGYQVENFGVSGNTLLKKGDFPYWESKKYSEALSFAPDIVLIKLGTNDAKSQNRIYIDSDFEKDYTALIQSFKNMNSEVKIILLLPITSFLNDSTSIWDPVIKKKIIPLTQKIAFDTEVNCLDLYQLFVDKPGLVPDLIHPSSLGATLIAKRVYEEITATYDHNFDLSHNLRLNQIKKKSFYGFAQTDFDFQGVPAKIVQPKHTLEGRPWIWRARFWGHEPQTDIALLERGFHLVYCDVSNLYGAPKAVERWNAFYKKMTEVGLADKVVLEGMSRGGLIIYNWAAANPGKVAGVYADAPVLDGKSWPGGFGKGKGYPSGWQEFKKVYDLSSESEAEMFKGNPIDQTDKIAAAGIQMFHVCGEADKVVPVDENTRIFEKKLLEKGADISVIYKEDVDHHPHSLKNPTPIVNFILRATGHKINFAQIVAPGSEYRSGAGWKEGKDWWAQARDIDALCKSSGEIDLLLIGNSITQGWGGSRALTTYRPGQAAANKHFSGLKWINAGISGDRTQHVAWRLENGSYENCNPKFVSLAIGVNNFGDNTAEEIVKGIELDVKLIQEKMPKATLLFFGPLPTGLARDSDRRKKYNKIHDLIAHLGEKSRIHYFNMLETFSTENEHLNMDYYSKDGIHLISQGYEVWAEFIKMTIQKLP